MGLCDGLITTRTYKKQNTHSKQNVSESMQLQAKFECNLITNYKRKKKCDTHKRKNYPDIVVCSLCSSNCHLYQYQRYSIISIIFSQQIQAVSPQNFGYVDSFVSNRISNCNKPITHVPENPIFFKLLLYIRKISQFCEQL